MSRHKPAIVFILATLFLDVLGFGLLIPVAPTLVRTIQADQVRAGALGHPQPRTAFDSSSSWRITARALRMRRETCICEIPTSCAICDCVMPS